jgi:uncharacterized membrane protein (DUF2068 family)
VSRPARSREDRLLPWIAAERGLRAIVLIGAGIVLLTHPHTDWASELTRLARHVGLDPHSNWIRRLIARVHRLPSRENVLLGVIGVGYGILEGAESYGLWRRRRWGEWLTVVATSLLIVPEVWELTKSTTALKVGALVVNLAIVAYLVRRIRRSGRPAHVLDPA